METICKMRQNNMKEGLYVCVHIVIHFMRLIYNYPVISEKTLNVVDMLT